MKSYLPEHREIVSALLDGKFLLNTDSVFAALTMQQNEYTDFFEQSFGYELVMDTELAYLRSSAVSEKDTRNFTLFLAVLCRELDLIGKDFKQEIASKPFDIIETTSLLKQSSKWEMLERIIGEDLNQFLKPWVRRNVLQRPTTNSFRFTKAIKVFFSFASDIAQSKLATNTPIV